MGSYHVYSNAGAGGPINYQAPVATVAGTTWAFALAAPGAWSFGVRAFDDNGEEENLDCSLAYVLDANGNNVTNLPSPPVGLRAFARPEGAVRVEWWCPTSTPNNAPMGFNVYTGPAQGPPNYAAPVATVPCSAGVFRMFAIDLVSGLEGGAEYVIGVRARNASGLEQNMATVVVMADSTGPGSVDQLIASTIV